MRWLIRYKEVSRLFLWWWKVMVDHNVCLQKIYYREWLNPVAARAIVGRVKPLYCNQTWLRLPLVSISQHQEPNKIWAKRVCFCSRWCFFHRYIYRLFAKFLLFNILYQRQWSWVDPSSCIHSDEYLVVFCFPSIWWLSIANRRKNFVERHSRNGTERAFGSRSRSLYLSRNCWTAKLSPESVRVRQSLYAQLGLFWFLFYSQIWQIVTED